MKKFNLIFVCMFFALSVQAAPRGVGDAYVSTIVPGWSGNSMVLVTTKFPTGCTRNEYEMPKSHPGFDMNYKHAVISRTMSRRVHIVMDGCTASGRGKLVSLYLE